ncbi:hypothetical protein BaRGS_00035197 [Batillaria attramentaria]|uniref:Uncharacterized protein n=1 Tax=Batillaria attramentaria TaxID=370345 RepID=A0ABD0JG03_9CAEN
MEVFVLLCHVHDMEEFVLLCHVHDMEEFVLLCHVHGMGEFVLLCHVHDMGEFVLLCHVHDMGEFVLLCHMRGIAMILAVVSAVLMTGSEASLSDTWDSVTHAAHTAWDWTKEHCSGSVGFPSGVSVTCSGRKRGVRGEPVDEGLLEALDQACPSFDVGPDAKLSDVVRAAFVEVDGLDGSTSILCLSAISRGQRWSAEPDRIRQLCTADRRAELLRGAEKVGKDPVERRSTHVQMYMSDIFQPGIDHWSLVTLSNNVLFALSYLCLVIAA